MPWMNPRFPKKGDIPCTSKNSPYRTSKASRTVTSRSDPAATYSSARTAAAKPPSWRPSPSASAATFQASMGEASTRAISKAKRGEPPTYSRETVPTSPCAPGRASSSQQRSTAHPTPGIASKKTTTPRPKSKSSPPPIRPSSSPPPKTFGASTSKTSPRQKPL